MGRRTVPGDSRHIHEDRYVPGEPGILPAPPPEQEPKPDPRPVEGRGTTKKNRNEAASGAASVVEEDV